MTTVKKTRNYKDFAYIVKFRNVIPTPGGAPHGVDQSFYVASSLTPRTTHVAVSGGSFPTWAPYLSESVQYL
jgi:hypothetical protein